MKSVRRLTAGGVLTTAAGLVVAATAWACVSGPAVNLSPASVKAGESVQISGSNFRQPEPVIVRFNALDGPILAELGEPRSQRVEGSVTIPEGTKPGSYVLLFTQAKPDGQYSQVPVRVLLTVTGETGAQPVLSAAAGVANDQRIESLATANDGVSGGTLLLVGLGVAGLALFLAGMAALMSGRAQRAPEPENVRS